VVSRKPIEGIVEAFGKVADMSDLGDEICHGPPENCGSSDSFFRRYGSGCVDRERTDEH